MNGTEVKDIKVIQAPLAGISDIVYRCLIRKYGGKNTLLSTEMISSVAINQMPDCNIIRYDRIEYPLSFQIMGHNPLLMAKAAKILQERASVIDINCGCPVQKIVKGGDGCALMRDIKTAKEVIKSVRAAVSTPLSVKFRLGWSNDEKNYIEFGKMAEGEGVDFITLHGRTRSEMYSGVSNREEIAKLKEAVKIPVYANGDIKTVFDIKNCIETTGADGVSIGRGFVGDFSFPYRAEYFFKTGKILPEPNLIEKIQMLKDHMEGEIEYRGEINAVKFMRKFYPFYISSVTNASKLRSRLVLLNTKKEIYEVLDNVLCIHAPV